MGLPSLPAVFARKPLTPIAYLQQSYFPSFSKDWRLKLKSFDFEVLYSRDDLNSADYISRHLQAATQCDLIAESAEQYVNFVMTQAATKALSKNDLATSQDATLQEVIRLILNGQQPEQPEASEWS